MADKHQGAVTTSDGNGDDFVRDLGFEDEEGDGLGDLDLADVVDEIFESGFLCTIRIMEIVESSALAGDTKADDVIDGVGFVFVMCEHGPNNCKRDPEGCTCERWVGYIQKIVID